MADRPTLNSGVWQTDPIDGRKFRQFMFGKQGESDNYRDTLSDEWDGKPKQAQIDEMNARYDNWSAIVNAPAVEPDPEQLLRDAEQAARDAQRAALDAQQRVLDLQDQIAQAQSADVEAQPTDD